MKKNRLAFILAAIIVILAVALSTVITYRVAVEPINQQIAQMQTSLSNIERKEPYTVAATPVPEVTTPQDGKTPPCYYEASQCRGENGKDAVSTHTEIKSIETIIKEQQANNSALEVQFKNGNLEIKATGDTLWQTLIPCSEFKSGCPSSLSGRQGL